MEVLTTDEIKIVFLAMQILRNNIKPLVLADRVDPTLILVDTRGDDAFADLLAQAALDSNPQPESEPDPQPNRISTGSAFPPGRPFLSFSPFHRDSGLFSYTAGMLGAVGCMARSRNGLAVDDDVLPPLAVGTFVPEPRPDARHPGPASAL